MKYKDTRWFVLMLTCLLLVLLFVWLMKRNPVAVGGAAESNQQSQQSETEIAQQKAKPIPLHDSAKQADSKEEAEKKHLEPLHQALEGKNVPVNFYGKVVDQENRPLPGVRISLRVRQWKMTSEGFGRSVPLEKISRTDGRFEIQDVSGDGFTIESFSKDGCQLEPTKLSHHSKGGSPDNPVAFKMWEKGTSQPLVMGGNFFTAIPDGRKQFIDLVGGKLSDAADSNGDLIVWIRRSGSNDKKFDWSFSVEAIDGGLAEQRDSYDAMFMAPDSGFTNTFSGVFIASDKGWGDAIYGRRFYIKTRNGKVYGRAEFEVYPSYGNSGEARIWIKYAINPTGSRILN